MRRGALRLAALALLALMGGFLWFALFPPRPAPVGIETDAIVVLTGGAGRLSHGLTMLEAHKAKRMLISGVDPKVTAKELAAKQHVPAALFACCIDLGQQAIDTRSNAGETAAWMRAHEYKSLRLVTSADHMRRAALELRAELGSNITVVPDPVAAERPTAALFREYLKYLLRRAATLVGR